VGAREPQVGDGRGGQAVPGAGVHAGLRGAEALRAVEGTEGEVGEAELHDRHRRQRPVPCGEVAGRAQGLRFLRTLPGSDALESLAYRFAILGFIFWIDEDGAGQFRSPNIWSKGNWLRHPGHRLTSFATRTTSAVEINEAQTLADLTAVLDSKNVRERIVVASIEGNVGAVTKGFQPYKLPASGLRRVSIWSDQHFKSNQECQIMADLIAVRQLFTYRGDTIRIPGYPAIQIDDQVRLTEETLEEVSDLYYVKGINSNLDMSTGDYWYDLETNWLGTDPFGTWAFDPANLALDTQDYLRAVGLTT